MGRMELRPYQGEAKEAVMHAWESGLKKVLIVLGTGCGKTIIFSHIAHDLVKAGERVLILAHRGELLTQAAEKLKAATGLDSCLEKAEASCIGKPERVVVGSVQTLGKSSRLERFSPDYFDTIIVDEAHHCMADTYQRVLDYFSGAKVLGVTATPNRSDMKDLGKFFDCLAYEYNMVDAIRDGYLAPISVRVVPLDIDISGVATSAGDYVSSALSSAIEPYLEAIADKMAEFCADRKVMVFTPLIKTSEKMVTALNRVGFRACEVNGNSEDRVEKIEAFSRGDYNVIVSSLLLTEGYDEPSVDCIVCLRPTQSRSLFCLDIETEVLTPSGFKSSVEVGELVAAFDTNTNEIRFVPALATVRRPLEKDEYFCSINGQSTSIRVTNKHRMVYDNKLSRGWKIRTAEEVANMRDGCKIPVAGHASFPGVTLTDAELRFIGWVMTDGTINRCNNSIMISQSSHHPWINELEETLKACGLKYGRHIANSCTPFHRTADNIVFTISKGKPRGTDKDKRGWGYLEEYISKDISEALFDMTEEQFDTMLEAINLGDGSKVKNQPWVQRSFHISKGNKTFIERLQMMAIQRGYRASISVYHNNKNPLYTLHLKKQNFVRIGSCYDSRPKWVKEDHTDEECWCVQNELGTLVTRRHGKVAIVGNCQIVGRGSRLYEGKSDLLLLDFLWLTGKHDLCRPSSIVAKDTVTAARMNEIVAASGFSGDLFALEEDAEASINADREAALARKLQELQRKQSALVDPMQFFASIGEIRFGEEEELFSWEKELPTSDQLAFLSKCGINPDGIRTKGEATRIIEKLMRRIRLGYSTPKQIRFLERKGFQHVGKWKKAEASEMIDLISKNDWRVPVGIIPGKYIPERLRGR